MTAIIVKEVSAKRAEAAGLTAEQLINKFESDPSAFGIAGHLLKDAQPAEIERLLLVGIPERYFTVVASEFGDSTTTPQTLARLFRTAFDGAPEPVRHSASARYVTLVKEGSGYQVAAYQENFFRASDLAYIDEVDRPLIRTHLLAQLKEGVSEGLLTAMTGIESHLSIEDVDEYVDPLVRAATTGTEPIRSIARERLTSVALHAPAAVTTEIGRRLGSWAEITESRGAQEIADDIRGIRELSQIPF